MAIGSSSERTMLAGTSQYGAKTMYSMVSLITGVR